MPRVWGRGKIWAEGRGCDCSAGPACTTRLITHHLSAAGQPVLQGTGRGDLPSLCSSCKPSAGSLRRWLPRRESNILSNPDLAMGQIQKRGSNPWDVGKGKYTPPTNQILWAKQRRSGCKGRRPGSRCLQN